MMYIKIIVLQTCIFLPCTDELVVVEGCIFHIKQNIAIIDKIINSISIYLVDSLISNLKPKIASLVIMIMSV